MRFRVRAVAVVVLAIALLAWFLRNANLAHVGREIRAGRLDLLVAALGVTALTYAIRSYRWQYLLAPIGPTRFANAFRTTVIGFAVSSLLPARAGEFVRPYLLARRENLSATAAFATIILERLLDTVTVALFLAAFLLMFDPGLAAAEPQVFHAVRVGGLMVGAAAVGALVVVFFLAGHPAALGRWSLRVERVLPGRIAHTLARLVERFAEGLAVLRQPGRLMTALVLSIPLWASIAAGIWLVSLAFRIEVPYTGAFLLMALLVVGVAVPTPGAIGGFHEAFRIGAVSFYGAPNDRAVGAAIVLHAVSFVPVTLAGIVFMAQEGLSLSRMRSLAEQVGAEEEAK
jgi:hypothetical protein